MSGGAGCVSAASSCVTQRRAPAPRPARVMAGASAGLGLRDEPFFEGELTVRGVPGAAVPLIDAAPVRAEQLRRRLDGSGASRQTTGSNSPLSARPATCSSSRTAASGSSPVRGSTRPRCLITIRPGERGLLPLRQRQRHLPRPLRLGPAQPRPAAASAVPKAGPGLAPVAAPHTDGAIDASEIPSVRASWSAHPARTAAKSTGPASLRLRVAKFDACASCASSRCDGCPPVPGRELARPHAQVSGDASPAGWRTGASPAR